MAGQPLHDGTKLIVRVLQDVVRQEAFESYADLLEVLKCRLATLRIRYDPDCLTSAIEQLERGGKSSLIKRPTAARSTLEAEPPVSREDAARLVQQLHVRVPVMPKARPLRVRHADRARALTILTEAIDRQLDACRAVEEPEP